MSLGMTVIMKGFSMNKMLGGMRRKGTSRVEAETNAVSEADLTGNSPEATAARSLRQFCESANPNSDDEITLLPPIIDAAESTPVAAAECARLIRKYLHRNYCSKPTFQYNAIMLMRILADNPGPTFTRNLDKKFTETAKELLRVGRDPSVRHILTETLDMFEDRKEHDETMAPLIEMWRKEKLKVQKKYGGRAPIVPRRLDAPPFDPNAPLLTVPFHDARSQNYFARAHTNNRLPGADELASRLEEARTSAKLLEQVVACTPAAEVLDHELIREFADRCLSASRSIQGYMTAQDPSPDNDTMEHLINTNEQLQQALNQHQRACLGARKQLGLDQSQSSQNPTPTPSSRNSVYGRGAVQAGSARAGLDPPALPSRDMGNGKGKAAADLWKLGTSEDDSQDPSRNSNSDSLYWRSGATAVGSSSSQQSAGRADQAGPRLVNELHHSDGDFDSGANGRANGRVGGLKVLTGAGDHSCRSDGGAGTSGVKCKPPPPDPVTPMSDEEDVYHATPKASGPVNRY